jgi:hypothetical protein
VDQVLTWKTAAVKRIDEVSVGTAPPDAQGHGRRTYAGDQKDLKKLELTKHGLIRNRYWEVSSQYRRIPVSLVLIVNADHIDRILTAFSKSKLEFLTTQFLLNRHARSLRPHLPDSDPKGGAETIDESDEAENNFELVLNGTVTLYERYPPPIGRPVRAE